MMEYNAIFSKYSTSNITNHLYYFSKQNEKETLIKIKIKIK